jgi:hypothetical protein
MQAESSPLLEQLQDIHGAGQPGWWPPAAGWWFLALILLLVVLLLLWKLALLMSVRRRRRAWLKALEELNADHEPSQSPRDYLAAMNRLFRAVAVKAFPGTACARLQGKEWVAFITSLMPEGSANDCLGALNSGPYEPTPSFDAGMLNERARTWVRLYG